ncbi:SAC3 family protein C isoform X2 [Corylus avellana]|uniref:SAC3 family protein C isoform X2 n=1 Tax=Corylus avellana TaxID=13451 RepID=UPI00286B9784|nr:SAC3 family protein C isoform X2 [Corylus avellana]
MERSRRQRPNPSSSSSSSTRSQSYRRFPSNPTQNSKSPSTNRDAPGLAKPRRAGQEDRDVDDPSNRPLLVGTCPFMCPAGERAQRERLRDLAVFERLDGNPRKTSSDLAVKKFCRTISIRDVQASDMRPLPVLEDTLDYLLSLSDSTEYPFQVVHDFIFDRTRSIRQDLSMQNIVNDKAIYMYEKMGESLSLWFRHVPIPIIKSKEMCFARRILRFFRIGNYKRFLLSAAAEASYLQYCIIEPYISEVRALALSCINNGGYKLHPYPLAHLCKLLMMKESDLVSFCNACGLETNTDEAGNKLLPTKQTTFCCPKGGFQSCSFSGLQPLER